MHPGPILEVSRGGRWIGSSKLAIAASRIARIETEQLEAGPLRSSTASHTQLIRV